MRDLLGGNEVPSESAGPFHRAAWTYRIWLLAAVLYITIAFATAEPSRLTAWNIAWTASVYVPVTGLGLLGASRVARGAGRRLAIAIGIIYLSLGTIGLVLGLAMFGAPLRALIFSALWMSQAVLGAIAIRRIMMLPFRGQ